MKGKETSGAAGSPIVVYYYDLLTDTDRFCRLLRQRFRASGHSRGISFVGWNCYRELPGRDGDLYIYDAVAMSALADKGFLHQLPDIIDVGDMFGWTIDKGKVRQKTYGVPLMLCANALICRREDDRNIRSIMDLHEPVAIPLRSMMMYYYLQAFCNYQNEPDECARIIRHLGRLIGGGDLLDRSTLADYDGVRRFNQRECRYFLGFTESMRLFEPDDYVVRFANFSDHEDDQKPLFMVDYASLGMHVREEKLLDCLDLLEIIADPQFIYQLCVQDGRLQYMLPACKSVYAGLSRLDPLYGAFFRLLQSEENGVFRYGARFYEDFYSRGDVLLDSLKQPGDQPPVRDPD